MDSRQPACKRSFEGNPLQNQDNDEASSTSKENGDGVKAKVLKEELDPLQKRNILEIIFSYLDANSIKNARQMNKLWSAEGAKMLITKCFIQIPKDMQITFMYNELNEFKKFLSLKSPIPNITIRTATDLHNWKLFGVIGPEAKAVKLKIMDDAEASVLLQQLDLIPNLKYLNFQVPSIKTMDILKSLMAKVKKDGSTLIIASVTLEADNLAKLTEIENFANCTNIQVEELFFNFKLNEFLGIQGVAIGIVNIMSKFLSTSQKTLKSLLINNCQLLSHLNFPCMTALTRMYLSFWPQNHGQMALCKFPPSFQFAEKAPNLQEFCTNYKFDDSLHPRQGFSLHLFENIKYSAPSVKRVKCFRDFTGSEINLLFRLFPKLEELQTCANWWYSVKWYADLWTLGTKLRKLHLYFDFTKLSQFFDVDAIFTGFDPETVRKIKEDPNLASYSQQQLEELRVKPSVLNLQDLELIEITFEKSRNPPKRMLTVAEKYAFRLLPKNPKIIINVKEGVQKHLNNAAMKALEEVSQFASVTVKNI